MEYEITPEENLSLGLAELWQYRELFYFFTWRDIKVKYKQTSLGFAWAVIQPLLTMAVFSLFFGRALKVPTGNIPYPIFVFSGLIVWNIFSSGITSAGNSMVTNSNIIKKIYFPRLIIPISAVLVAFFDFLMAFMVFCIFLFFFPVHISIFNMLLAMPAGLIVAVLSTFGIGCLLAALNIKYRDFRYVIPFLVQTLLFVTPVIYPISVLPYNWMKYVMALNPMYSAIELFRSGITGSLADSQLLLISISSALVFFISGLFYFRKTESYFADLA